MPLNSNILDCSSITRRLISPSPVWDKTVMMVCIGCTLYMVMDIKIGTQCEIKQRMIYIVYTRTWTEDFTGEGWHWQLHSMWVWQWPKNFIKYRYMWLYLFEIALTILQCVDMYMYVWIVIYSLELDDI